MFNNVGGKIKVFAKVLFIIDLIISVILTGIIIKKTSDSILGLCTFIVSFFAIWLAALLLYGFGKLIENSDTIVECIENNFPQKEESTKDGDFIVCKDEKTEEKP